MTDLFVIRLCLFYAAQFVVIGIQMPFFPMWLADRGLDVRAIGVLLAAPMIVRVPIVPVAGLGPAPSTHIATEPSAYLCMGGRWLTERPSSNCDHSIWLIENRPLGLRTMRCGG